MENTIQSVDEGQIARLFEQQKQYQYTLANTSAKERKAKLRALLKAVANTHRQAIRDALMADFRKPQADVDLSEVFPITTEIKYALSHLNSWMSKHRVATPLAFIGASSYVRYQPKGQCLIIAPWNFPVNLSLGPLVSAVAAGNAVILKPSEHTPHATAVIKHIVREVFDEREVAVVEGGVETSTALLELPFNHIFFTGAPAVGKVVMRAAAKHLASVSLELGGKSPTIVDATADIKTAAKRIVWGKFFNSGQICIAPDYVLVHESKKDALVAALKASLQTFYGDDAQRSNSFALMVNQRHAERVHGYVADALDKGAKLLYGGRSKAGESYLEPTLVENAPMDSALMQNEIFGPVLPIFTFSDIDEATAHINAGEKPLALYVYSRSKRNIEKIVANTRAGGTCINHNDLHFFNPNLPFGGANNSGIGRAHGFHGFKAFSEARAVYSQHLPSALDLLAPPYNRMKERLIEWTVKWL
jgi:aldehyde dehydrogenase (NAD+)